MPDPPPTDLAHLPLWGQITAVVAFIGAAFGVIRQGWKAEAKKPETTDTVVISGAFADSKPIRELTESLNELRETLQRTNRMQGERSEELREQIEEFGRHQHGTNERLDKIATAIGQGVSVKIAPGA